MRSPQRKENSILIIACAVFLLLGPRALAQDSLVYKGPRGRKNIQELRTGGAASLASMVNKGEKKPYVYDPTGKPDPFKSFIAKQEAFEKKRKKRKPKTYLETVELSQLDLIATIINKRGNWAMVKDAKGIGHVIRVGTAIGTNGGVVYKIEEGKVVIRETHVDFRGRKIIKDIVKKLPSLQQ